MKKTFLYKLFKYSKACFFLVIIYLICNAVFFNKKMDTVAFPYNSMFTIDFTKNYTSSAYRVKVNGTPIGITNNLYWKKDFLEESLGNYAKYKSNNDEVFMNDYLNRNVAGEANRAFLSGRLCPDKLAADKWLIWYITFAGYNIPTNATIELFKYEFVIRNQEVHIQDSVIIHKISSF